MTDQREQTRADSDGPSVRSHGQRVIGYLPADVAPRVGPLADEPVG